MEYVFTWAVILLVLGLLLWAVTLPPCLRSERQWVEPWTSMMPLDDKGNEIPIYHPGYWSEVCVERAPR